ncbi:MAG: GcrA family cell cycle regulator [Alphaproteobacteria bacterium]
MGRSLHSPETIDAIRRLWKGRLSATEIGLQLALSRNAVIGIVTRKRAREGEASWPVRGASGNRPPRPDRSWKNNHSSVPRVPAPPKRILVDPIDWLARESDQCAWIEDDVGDAPIDELKCCGQQVEPGASWCAFHFRIATAEPDEDAPNSAKVPRPAVTQRRAA